jgi:hypothetical protein
MLLRSAEPLGKSGRPGLPPIAFAWERFELAGKNREFTTGNRSRRAVAASLPCIDVFDLDGLRSSDQGQLVVLLTQVSLMADFLSRFVRPEDRLSKDAQWIRC